MTRNPVGAVACWWIEGGQEKANLVLAVLEYDPTMDGDIEVAVHTATRIGL
jgi:hypothetical protein